MFLDSAAKVPLFFLFSKKIPKLLALFDGLRSKVRSAEGRLLPTGRKKGLRSASDFFVVSLGGFRNNAYLCRRIEKVL